MKNYPTFHCHPNSFDSASTPTEMVARELELGSGMITVTDHGSLGACREVYDLARTKGIKSALGIEGYYRDDNCPILRAHGVTEPKAWFKYAHITMHARDQEAYYALVRKMSLAPLETHGSESKPIWGWADLEELGQYNITCGSGCLIGMVQRHLLMHGRKDIAKAYYERLRSTFKHFYVEVFPHRCTHNWVDGVFLTVMDDQGVESKQKWYADKKLRLLHAGEMSAKDMAALYAKKKQHPQERLLAVKNRHRWDEAAGSPVLVNCEHIEDFIENECLPWATTPDVQDACNQVVLEFAREYGDPVVISDDSHFARADDKVVQDIKLRQGGNWRFFSCYQRQSSEDSWSYFKNTGVAQAEFESWVDNNLAWADGFKDFRLIEKPELPTKFYPGDSFTNIMAKVKAQGRMDWRNRAMVERLTAEIDLLRDNGTIDLLPYFLLGEDVCNAYASRGLLSGVGRGSAAGLLLTYLLGITHVDPLPFDLSMNRFLTKDRINSGKLPDIDQDLPGRELLVDEEKIRVAQVTLEDGARLEVPYDGYVELVDGNVASVRRALEQRLDVRDWGVDTRKVEAT